MAERPEVLRVGTDAQVVAITSEPVAVFTRRGYFPAVEVEMAGTGEKKMLYISAASIASALQPMVEGNQGKFMGIKIDIKKESGDRYARYVIEPAKA